MNGAQDMGGKHGFGPVKPEPNEPVFHAEWEKRAFALTLAMGMPGGWNIDMGRFARENRPPAEYLIDELLPDLVRGARTHDEGARAGVSATKSTPAMRLRPPKPRQAHADARRRGEDAASRRPHRARDQHAGRQFKSGDRVRAKNINPSRIRGCPLMCAARSAPSSA